MSSLKPQKSRCSNFELLVSQHLIALSLSSNLQKVLLNELLNEIMRFYE